MSMDIELSSRTSVCWKCGKELTNYPVCPACKWMVCPDCGMCRKPSYGKCFGTFTYDSTEVRYLRRKWSKIDLEHRPLPDGESFDMWCNLKIDELHKKILDEEKAQKQAQEKAQEDAANRIENMEKKLQNGDSVINKSGKIGVLDSVRFDSKFKIIKIAFEDGIPIEYVFPDAFEKGFLRFRD